MPTMKAVRIHAYGGPEVLIYEDAPRPVPEKGQVLIRVHAASVNPIDWKIRAGFLKEFMPYSFPLIPGWDLSGVVDSVGSDVTSWKAGDQVYAMADVRKNGAYAEYAVVEADLLAAKPKALDHVHSAAIPLAGLTAHHGLFEFANLKAGQKVLILGASGGVGSFAVQLAKWKGAYVIGTASTRNQGFLREMGVDQAVDYATTPVEKAVKDVDIVIDTVGGEAQQASFATLKKGGILASTLGQPMPPAKAPAGISVKAIQNRPDAAALKEIAGLCNAGKLVSFVEKEFPLNEARKAHEMNQTGHTRGKIVLRTA